MAGIAPAFTMSATDLFAAYTQNEAEANKKYLDKVVLVKGAIDDVSRTDSTLTILLQSNDIAGGVSCNITDKNELTTDAKKGNNISIKGRCTGFLADVTLADCTIEK